jgi:hypothetical protein
LRSGPTSARYARHRGDRNQHCRRRAEQLGGRARQTDDGGRAGGYDRQARRHAVAHVTFPRGAMSDHDRNAEKQHHREQRRASTLATGKGVQSRERHLDTAYPTGAYANARCLRDDRRHRAEPGVDAYGVERVRQVAPPSADVTTFPPWTAA